MLKVYKKSFLIKLLIVILFIELLYAEQIPTIKVIDEVIAIFSIIYIGIWILSINKKRMDLELRKVIYLLMILCALGFCGNTFSGITPNFFAAGVDCLGVIKSIVVFIFVFEYLSNTDAMRVVRALLVPSKIFLWCAIFFGILSVFVNIGMGGEVRFGLRAYQFIFEHSHIFAITSMCALLLITVNEKNKQKIYLYTLITCICQILTTKGPSLVWCSMIFIMYRYYAHNKKIKLWLIVMLGVLCICLGQYQLTNYFMNSSAPRALFIKYGIVTANKYFPLGSGFATYGSEMARVHYSELYYRYGFNNVWGMTQEKGMFLNDNYWPMIAGQIGYIGVVLFLIIYFKIFKKVQQVSSDRIVRAVLVSNYIYIMIHSLGSASLTGMEGVFLFLIFGIVAALYKRSTNTQM